jgi:hypothetical protein
MSSQPTPIQRKDKRDPAGRVAATSPEAPGGVAPARKHFRACPHCPFFCRVEESFTACTRCGTVLQDRCPCGGAIEDPVMAVCFNCADRLRGRLNLRGEAGSVAKALSDNAGRR